MVGSKLVRNAIFGVGLMLCSFPLISNVVEGFYQKDAITTYNQVVSDTNTYDIEESLRKANEYNSLLYGQKSASLGSGDSSSLSILGEESYNSIIDMGNGVMGSIEIPKISVNLPIYHGTSDEVLSVGVGHVFGSSFPVGGISTRSILTGHRGLPNAKLFTRLDEIVEGDLFFVRVLGDTLAYRVCDIMVIEPDDVDSVDIVDGRDLVSLITCTPYGINTHRLVVTGERVPYVEEEYTSIETNSLSYRELLFSSIPFIFIGLFIVVKVVGYVRGRKKGDKELDEVKED